MILIQAYTSFVLRLYTARWNPIHSTTDYRALCPSSRLVSSLVTASGCFWCCFEACFLLLLFCSYHLVSSCSRISKLFALFVQFGLRLLHFYAGCDSSLSCDSSLGCDSSLVYCPDVLVRTSVITHQRLSLGIIYLIKCRRSLAMITSTISRNA